MKYNTIVLSILFMYGANSQSHWQRQRQHQRYYKKQDFSVYSSVVPLPTSTTSLALIVNTATTPICMPTTTVAPVQVTTAPSLAPTSPSSSTTAPCIAGSPCVGDLTYFIAGLGACGVTNDGNSELVVALPYGLMGTLSNDNPYCGQTITIEHSGNSVVATVVDKCMGCDNYSIDLSIDAFSSLGIDLEVGHVIGTWYFNN